MAIFIVSDLHLGHSKDFIYGARGFENVEDMNETIIRKWNEVVNYEDDVYVLGDLVMGARGKSSNASEAEGTASYCKGKSRYGYSLGFLSMASKCSGGE